MRMITRVRSFVVQHLAVYMVWKVELEIKISWIKIQEENTVLLL